MNIFKKAIKEVKDLDDALTYRQTSTVPPQISVPPIPPVKTPKNEFGEIIDGMLNKHYTIQVAIRANAIGDIMSSHYLNQGLYKTYKHVKLVNINGMGTGQVHFVAEDGSYLLLPWCYIIAMFPEKEN